MNQNKDKRKTCFVSVESRKGGVGKTTAALCLAKLFLEKGWEVLFLDTDITGTNVVDALESAFWRDSVHVVTGAEDGKKRRRANLLLLFERGFMAGKGTPDFRRARQSKKDALTWEKGKINVIGSEIYGGEGSKLICKPSILFDELHAFWFAKCIKEICSRFRKEVGKDKQMAIVIDNSPGYVGIGPVIQEWLIDWGVDVNKFLFVSSLDEQDLTACLKGMDTLHLTYTGKWKVAKKLAEQKNNKTDKTKEGMPEWEGDEMRFAIRLLENGRDDGELEFYLDRGLKSCRNENERLGDTFEKKIGKYQGIVVNRVAQRFKKGWWAYKMDRVMNENGKAWELLCDSEHRGEVSTNVMVEYSEYIDSQFTKEEAVRREMEWRQHPEELEWICKYASMAVKSYRKRRSKKRNELVEFWERLNDYQVVIDDLLGRLAGVSMYTLRDLVREEWQPKAIGIDFQRWMWRAFQREFPPLGEWMTPKDIEHRIHAMEEVENIVRTEAENAFSNKQVKRDRVIWVKILFSGSAALSLAVKNWEEIPFEKTIFEFGRVVGEMCAVEAEHWAQAEKTSKDSIGMFLSQERLSKEKYKNKLFRRIRPISHFLEDSREMSVFYESFAKAQARILDLDRDVEFLISVIMQAVRDDRSERGLLPYIGGVAENVIVDKRISHEQGMEDCLKGFRIAESLGQFKRVLRKVIARWEIE